ncbi:hypothetical protein GGR53DRAFT_461988 [Hypoxylon sp. FL1150]|nr:hypothetical protein GGR53DRAFT_461988 [Hypoxylon sp. FL1150]
MPPPIPDPGLSSTPLSSPDSFATATESPLLGITTTDISSPVVDHQDAGDKSYSKANQLPPELKQHCQIYLEENLYLITLNLLNSLLSSSRNGQDDPYYCPPPGQLSLLNSAIVNPKFTTRPREEGWDEISAESLVYLRSLLARLGPLNGHFKEAFRFTSDSRHATPDSSDPEFGADDEDRMRLYHKDSLWRQGQDFFHVVGWAFNCSVLYPNRWRHWRNWLKFMLDLLDQDLIERHKIDEESGDADSPMLRDSILAGYISQRSGRSAGGLKCILEAMFADGSVAAGARFQEIWVKEHKERPKNNAKKRKRQVLNIDQGSFGGYLDDDSVYSSRTSEPPTPQKRRTNSGDLIDADFQALEPAYVESIPLRQRLFSLLSYICHYLPRPPLDFSDLYQRFETKVKSLPLPIFTAFVNNRISALRQESQISVLQGILLLLLPGSATKPGKVDPSWDETDERLTAEILERCFLPYPANTILVEDNAKVSILLETLLHMVWLDGSETFSDDFRAAVEKGIAAREAKAKKKKTSTRGRNINVEDPDAEARVVLELSAQRLSTMVDLIEAAGEETGSTGADIMEEDEEDEEDNEATFMTAIDRMEEDDEDEDENESGKKYCLCRGEESGDMIACDNSACAYEWFHWECVGLQTKPRGKWLCPECAVSMRRKRK